MHCRQCGKKSYSEFCFNHKPRKPISKKGKEYYKWQEFKGGWFKRHQPDFDGYYKCHICDRSVHKDDVVLDHVVPQGWGHKRKYEDGNIKPAHIICNAKKGSKR